MRKEKTDLEIADMVGTTPMAVQAWRSRVGLLRTKHGGVRSRPDGPECDREKRGPAADKPVTERGKLDSFIPIQEIVKREKAAAASPREASELKGLKRLLLEMEVEGCEIVVRSENVKGALKGCEAVMALLGGV